MTKKLLSILIAFILLFPAGIVGIQQAQAKTLIENCIDEAELLPEYVEKITPEPKNGPKFQLVAEEIKLEPKTHIGFRIAFETARNSYHTYVRCIFDRAFITILGSAGADTEGIFTTSAPNFIDAMPSWLTSDAACIDQDELVEILRNSSPAQGLAAHLLDQYHLYVQHLNRLFDTLKSLPSNISNIGEFAKVFEQNRIFKQLFDNEIKSAIVGLDAAFISLKELRQAFVMHVHFQCMLENLEMYRRILGNLRSIITVLPPLIHDASMTN